MWTLPQIVKIQNGTKCNAIRKSPSGSIIIGSMRSPPTYSPQVKARSSRHWRNKAEIKIFMMKEGQAVLMHLIYWLAYLFDDTYQLTMASIIMNNTLIQYVWCIYISCSYMIIWFWLDKKEMLSSVTTAHLPLITSPMPCSSPACPYTSSTSDLQIATSFWPNLGSDTVSRLCGACPAVIRPKHKHNLVTEVRLELISKQNNYTYWFYIYSLPGVFSCISFIMRQQYRALKSIY